MNLNELSKVEVTSSTSYSYWVNQSDGESLRLDPGFHVIKIQPSEGSGGKITITLGGLQTTGPLYFACRLHEDNTIEARYTGEKADEFMTYFASIKSLIFPKLQLAEGLLGENYNGNRVMLTFIQFEYGATGYIGWEPISRVEVQRL